MGGVSPDTAPSGAAADERLDSWKAIAAYCNRDVTTVQRWEKREGMPVHRHLHDRMGSVYAYRGELDAWAHGRKVMAAQENGTAALATEIVVSDVPDALPPAEPASFLRRRRVLGLLAAACIVAIGAGLWFQRTEYFWRNPIADYRFHTLADFDGVKEAAAISRDGQFIAFLSDRDGQMDVWVTQVGSGQFHNLTNGTVTGLVNPSVRVLGFSADGSMVTCWARQQDATGQSDVSIWRVPTLGRSAGALPGRRRGGRLVAGRHALGVPHIGTRRSAVHLERRPRNG